jgi:hypothetical protein
MDIYQILSNKLRERKLNFIQNDCLFKIFFGSLDVFIQLENEEYCSSWIVLEESYGDDHIELSDFDYYGDLPYEDKITELLDHSFEKSEKYFKLKIGIENKLNSLKEYIESFDLNLTLNKELSFNSIIQEDYE